MRASLLLLLAPPTRATLSTLEEKFLSHPSSATAATNLQYITSEPHVAGTPGDYKMAKFVADKFTDFGIPSVTHYDLDVLLNYPLAPPSVKLLGDAPYTATMAEDLLDFDTTSDTLWRNHTFHGYAPSGTATAPMVYANYGRPEDFAVLAALNVTVANKIVLVRYAECFRGLKVMNAQALGAVGVIIYSDPADDGYDQGEVYPDGPWRPGSAVQRGSVQFNSLCAGDPMRADTRYAERGDTVESLCNVSSYKDLIPTIPSIPMSYDDARVFLQALGGPPAPADFVGGLDLPYTVGPSSAAIEMIIQNEDKVTSIPNIIGKIPGSASAADDMPVLMGNHRDAWIFGAGDPNSGTASLLEVAKGFGALVKAGWQPRNTIYLLSWSGEEYGLLGSTGWGELESDSISRASAYLNVDTIVSGDVLSVSATPALAALWREVMGDLGLAEEHRFEFGNGPVGEIVDANVNKVMDGEIGTLGSGSDYTVFLDRLGIASLDFSFGKKGAMYGVYHSIYDSYDWMNNYGGDQGVGSCFELMSFGAKIWGVLGMRLADSDVLPFDQREQGAVLESYCDDVDVEGLQLGELRESVGAYKAAAEGLAGRGETCSGKQCLKVNEQLALVERMFLSEAGLPGRTWFKHTLQAPGLYLGYAAEAFPGVQQALDDGDMEVAQQQVDVLVERVQAAAAFMDHTP